MPPGFQKRFSLYVTIVAMSALVLCGCARQGDTPGPQAAEKKQSGADEREQPRDRSNVQPPPKEKPAVKADEPFTQRGRLTEWVTPQGIKVKLSAEHDPWADAVVSFKMGTPTPKKSTNPWAAVGKPNYQGDDNVPNKYVALGHGGELVLEFIDNVLVDGPGPDLVIFEIGGAVEPTEVAISEDGKTWIDVGRAGGSKSMLDIAPFVRPGQRFRFVRLIDARAGLSNDTDWAGADIDAVGALHSRPISGAPARAEIEKLWNK